MAPLATPLDTKLVRRSVQALLTHVQREEEKAGKAQLLESSVPISVIIALKTIPQTGGRSKPYMIELPHPLFDPKETEVCLIVKDPQRHYKDKLQEKGVEGIARVIGVGKLKTKFKQYEAKRQLCSMYDVFLADKSVLPTLPHLLGKVFFEKNKKPLPVDLYKQNWGEQFRRTLGATPFYLSEGLCSAVRAAHTGLTADEITANIITAVEKLATVLPKQFKSIQALHIKTHNSIALPIYHSLPGLTAIAVPAGRPNAAKSAGKRKEPESAEESGSEESGEQSEEEQRPPAKKQAAGKPAGKAPPPKPAAAAPAAALAGKKSVPAKAAAGGSKGAAPAKAKPATPAAKGSGKGKPAATQGKGAASPGTPKSKPSPALTRTRAKAKSK